VSSQRTAPSCPFKTAGALADDAKGLQSAVAAMPQGLRNLLVNKDHVARPLALRA